MYGPATTPASTYGSNAAAAWAAGKTGLASVYVGVIDEGIQLTHPDLAGQVWVNPADPADGADNDGNGLVDDTNGWDFANNDASIYDGGTKGSLDDHGTHVSGTIGGKANGQGVVGVNWNIRLVSAKFLGRRGGTTANAVKAVDYLTNLKNRGINIVASNNSWVAEAIHKHFMTLLPAPTVRGLCLLPPPATPGLTMTLLLATPPTIIFRM